MDYKERNTIDEILILVLEGQASEEQIRFLNQILRSNGEQQQYCADFLALSAALKKTDKILNMFIQPEPKEYSLYSDFLHELAREEKIAPEVCILRDDIKNKRELIQKVEHQKVVRNINKPFVFSVFASIAALFILVAYLQLSPQFITVATVKDCMNIQFADNMEVSAGSRLTNRKNSYWLRSGVLEIEFDYGAKVVIEAPAEFNLDSAEKMLLSSGRLYAKVPGSATGFMVDTPNSRVIDLGTEFGVKVDIDGISDVHMFKGKASLIPGSKGKTQNSQMLTVGKAKRIDTECQVKDIPIEEKRFIRMISSKTGIVWRGQNLSLADIVGGGNGLGTGNTGVVIDYQTGRLKFVHSEEPVNLSNKEFVKTVYSPFVDGIFVPNGGSQKVSSRGDIFANCPKTQGLNWEYIANGPWKKTENPTEFSEPWELGGIQYGTKEKPAIYLHSNNGITFDLNAIRNVFPHQQIIRFTAFCGISENTKKALLVGNLLPKASIYVLLDGYERFEKIDMEIGDGVIPITLDIRQEDRFLTLITTNGNDNNRLWDWVLFAEPCLHLQ